MLHAMLFSTLMTGFVAEDTVQEPEATPEVQYNPTTVVEFDGLRVDGLIDGPGMTLVTEVKSLPFNPMIQIRADFNEEMAQSPNLVR